jgi:hypothetical protein
LAEAVVTDKAGKAVDLTEFLKGSAAPEDSHAGHDHD